MMTRTCENRLDLLKYALEAIVRRRLTRADRARGIAVKTLPRIFYVGEKQPGKLVRFVYKTLEWRNPNPKKTLQY